MSRDCHQLKLKWMRAILATEEKGGKVEAQQGMAVYGLLKRELGRYDI